MHDLVKQQMERVICSNYLGAFYRHINSCIQYRTPICAYVNNNSMVVTSDFIKANMFNNFYATTGVVHDGKILFCLNMESPNVLDTIVFTE